LEEKYPYCRPSVRINKDTPKTHSKLSQKELRNRCKEKITYEEGSNNTTLCRNIGISNWIPLFIA
jgi:hypothetical protein